MKKLLLLLVLATVFMSNTCSSPPVSTSGIQKATAKVATDLNGNTIEQKNIIERLKRDNLPGSIKHLYIISAYSGQVLMYSTVMGKATSGNKRITPSTISYNVDNTGNGFDIHFGGTRFQTQEVLGDDGAYGTSGDYLFWFDSKGVYHQQYLTGGAMIHISDHPIAVKSVIINVETH